MQYHCSIFNKQIKKHGQAVLFSLERFENDELFYAIYTIVALILLGFFKKMSSFFKKSKFDVSEDENTAQFDVDVYLSAKRYVAESS